MDAGELIEEGGMIKTVFPSEHSNQLEFFGKSSVEVDLSKSFHKCLESI